MVPHKIRYTAIFAGAIILTLTAHSGAAQTRGAFDAFGGTAGLGRVAHQVLARVFQPHHVQARLVVANIPRRRAS